MSAVYFTVLKVNKSNLWSEQCCMTGNYCDTEQECCKPIRTKQPCSSLVSNTQMISIKEMKSHCLKLRVFFYTGKLKSIGN